MVAMQKTGAQDLPFKDWYTIQDLENLSGIQAHTLRIWEKRYDLLHPVRGSNNIRYYSPQELRKWLNISALYHQGWKISKIAALSTTELVEHVRQATRKDATGHLAMQSLIAAMLTFDQPLFDETVTQLLSQKPFREVFRTVFIPLLQETGLMWQTETITVAQEHFLSNLLRQKLLHQIEQLPSGISTTDKNVYVLFLPANEVHELGLLFSYYELTLHGKRCIYLGQSVPVDSLRDLKNHFPRLVYVTAFTIQPSDEQVDTYLSAMSRELLRKGKDELWVSGRKIQSAVSKPALPGIHYILSPEDFLKRL